MCWCWCARSLRAHFPFYSFTFYFFLFGLIYSSASILLSLLLLLFLFTLLLGRLDRVDRVRHQSDHGHLTRSYWSAAPLILSGKDALQDFNRPSSLLYSLYIFCSCFLSCVFLLHVTCTVLFYNCTRLITHLMLNVKSLRSMFI